MKAHQLPLLVLTILSFAIVGCSSNGTPASSPIGKEASINWKLFMDTTKYKAVFLEESFDTVTNNNQPAVNDLPGLLHSKRTRTVALNSKQQIILAKLITDPGHFTEGRCGSFFLNAGFVFRDKNNKDVAHVIVGCGYDKWVFSPNNSLSKYGLLNQGGLLKLQKLLDELNSI